MPEQVLYIADLLMALHKCGLTKWYISLLYVLNKTNFIFFPLKNLNEEIYRVVFYSTRNYIRENKIPTQPKVYGYPITHIFNDMTALASKLSRNQIVKSLNKCLHIALESINAFHLIEVYKPQTLMACIIVTARQTDCNALDRPSQNTLWQ